MGLFVVVVVVVVVVVGGGVAAAVKRYSYRGRSGLHTCTCACTYSAFAVSFLPYALTLGVRPRSDLSQPKPTLHQPRTLDRVLVRDDDEPEIRVMVGEIEVDEVYNVVSYSNTCSRGLEPGEPRRKKRGRLEEGS